MIHLVEALNYRSLQYISRRLQRFHVLVGPNASGKTTSLDVIAFLGQLVSNGLDAAINERSPNFRDLLFRGMGSHFELAIEAVIPDKLRRLANRPNDFHLVRYDVAIGTAEGGQEIENLSERVSLKHRRESNDRPRSLFPDFRPCPDTLAEPKSRQAQWIVNKVRGGNDNFYSEAYSKPGKGWAPAFRLGPRKSALGNLPEDETKFPTATWLKRLLTDNVNTIV